MSFDVDETTALDEYEYEDDEPGRWEQLVGRLKRFKGSKAEPLYPRLLRLKHIRLNGWQRAALVEGMVLVGALAALADKATAWTPLVLPIAAAAVVKFHDVLSGLLPSSPEPPDEDAA